ncbi:permease protein, ABC-type oligopeptide transporter [Streptomyces laurentii]|uniref:Permease protein, ABC-type oligopeptide transporter n=1 Tax=Streptomyces laurentii TaxID=39478 RepID=A0A169P673_STRLU|nr:permease protein, ABC-type oligopeptide transporter [Streptomyces laurentii]
MGVRKRRKGAEGGTRTSGAAGTARTPTTRRGILSLRVAKRVTVPYGVPGSRPDTPGDSAGLWQAAPGQATLD